MSTSYDASGRGRSVASTFQGFQNPFCDGRQLGHVLVAAPDGAGLELSPVLGDFGVGLCSSFALNCIDITSPLTSLFNLITSLHFLSTEKLKIEKCSFLGSVLRSIETFEINHDHGHSFRAVYRQSARYRSAPFFSDDRKRPD